MRLGLHAPVLQYGGDDRRADALAVRHDRVQRSRGAFAEDGDALKEGVRSFGEIGDLLEHVGRLETERVRGEVLVLARETEDCLLRLVRVAHLGRTRGRDQGVGRPGGRGDDHDAFSLHALHDLGHALKGGRRRDGGPAELEHGPRHPRALAIAITSPSIAEAVASPPAPGPLQTSRGTRSPSSVITFVGPVACPSSESAATSSGPTRAFVARSPKSATARYRMRAPRAAAPVSSDAGMPRKLARRTLSG